MTPRAGRRRPEKLARRIPQLAIGLYCYGLGIALIVLGNLGSAPWDVLAQGIITHIPLTFGTVTILISLVVLLFWIPLRERPGLGTVLNALLVGPAADLSFWFLPIPEALWLRVVYMALGIVGIGFATGLYIGSRFGPGPRDGLMTGLHRTTKRPIWVVRTGLEFTVVVIGWLLGGVVGIGTIAFAVFIGPLCQLFMRLFNVRLRGDPEPS